MATKATEVRASETRTRAEASFKKEERARDGAKAMAEYQANAKLVRERMAQLRALRLAKGDAGKVSKRLTAEKP